MKVTNEQMDKIREKLRRTGYPPEAIISGKNKIVVIDDKIVSTDGEMISIVKDIMKPKAIEKPKEIIEEPKEEVIKKPVRKKKARNWFG